MNPFATRAEPASPPPEELEPLELTSADVAFEPTFDREQWAESRTEESGSGGRQVLGTALIVLAAGWLGYIAWSARKRRRRWSARAAPAPRAAGLSLIHI